MSQLAPKWGHPAREYFRSWLHRLVRWFVWNYPGHHHQRKSPRRKCQNRSPQYAATKPKMIGTGKIQNHPSKGGARTLHQSKKASSVPKIAPQTNRTQNSNLSDGGSSLTI